jgi:hypothetical protein
MSERSEEARHGSKATSEMQRDSSKSSQDPSFETASTKQPIETGEIEEVEELEFCFRGNPGMIITRKRTEATIRHKGRLL